MAKGSVEVFMFLGLFLYCQCLLLDTSTTREITPPLTTHILDTSRGLPADNVSVRLFQGSTEIEKGFTSTDGRAGFLNGSNVQSGVRYTLHFDTGTYFARQHLETFYPFVEVVFTVKDPGQHYHVPLLLSPYSYSTYRGS